MKQFEGTKGPWRLGRLFGTVLSDNEPRRLPRSDDDKFENEKNFLGGYLVCESALKDDAQLIAAAPDLLDACMLSLRHMQKTGITCDNADIYITLDTAIKKALGQGE